MRKEERKVSPEQKSGGPVVIDAASFHSAPKLYAQNVILQASHEEVMMQFCIRQPAPDGGGVTLLNTQVVVYVGLRHAMRLHKLLGEQLAEVDRQLGDIAAKAGLPGRAEVRRRIQESEIE